jgi:hypothetical protein
LSVFFAGVFFDLSLSPLAGLSALLSEEEEFFLNLFSDTAFARVIGNVPALAFELNRRRRESFSSAPPHFRHTHGLLV